MHSLSIRSREARLEPRLARAEPVFAACRMLLSPQRRDLVALGQAVQVVEVAGRCVHLLAGGYKTRTPRSLCQGVAPETTACTYPH